ncbi:HD domain-containing protein [Desulfuromusa kysingii]|uniref:HD domain-containing protein n=1 Tax=Desulfuromusa kysingii TaxID=37625 RepID=A0A1H4AYW9_9BACT|nr:HD domain-containing protein [Desulfuromusa kysingii]SEA41105.1 HD domain-containing protein [Desulfuromusa kysingii]
MWDQDTYLKAWNFASVIHRGQTIPGKDIPYLNHLGLVTMEATAAIARNQNIRNPNLLIQCALLHDSIEDTATTYTEIKSEFGLDVAAGVLALSKNKKLPTKQEQMLDSLTRIKQQPQEVWMVKLCDRITNLQPPPEHWHKEKILQYRDEAHVILEQLGKANQFLSARLKKKIDNYIQYLK